MSMIALVSHPHLLMNSRHLFSSVLQNEIIVVAPFQYSNCATGCDSTDQGEKRKLKGDLGKN